MIDAYPEAIKMQKTGRILHLPMFGLGTAITGVASFWGTYAFSGGYVAPIIEIAGPVDTIAASPAPYWLALIPLGLLAALGLSQDGNGRPVSPPAEYGGPCFCEGTLVLLERGWIPVEDIREGELIKTSNGTQKVLSVESWQPVEFRDRPCVVKGVRVSKNHGISDGRQRIPAQDVSTLRSPIDGSRYFHILVRDHSWLYAKADVAGEVLEAESLYITSDLAISKTFPELVALHKARAVAPDAYTVGKVG
ncbi:Hint domain-containing protein [Paracoccus rhizosphaerae]|uniref:Hint domain-containing protein n=1 Tax=Paracoccus rhizosphaerae TaxID=1133347 RepID=A0ABV6CDU2_9RHOB|nr:hypothetical protein [Paracoccus rhizosphaerae]